MHAVPQVVFTEDASPLARVFARTLNKALLNNEGAALLRAISIPFAIRALKGRQAITIDPADDLIEVRNGVSSNAGVVIKLDLNDPSTRPGIEKGLWRHPLELYRIGKLLSLDPPDWQDSAREFWESASDVKDRPAQLVVYNTIDGSQLMLGDESATDSRVEIHGKTPDLQSLFNGQSLLVADAMQGKLKVSSSLRHVAILSGIGQRLLLGEK